MKGSVSGTRPSTAKLCPSTWPEGLNLRDVRCLSVHYFLLVYKWGRREMAVEQQEYHYLR